MFKIIYPQSDATLYESNPTANTGLDEILEVGKRLSTAGSSYLKSRSVIKFDMNDVSSALTKYNVNLTDCKFMLQLYTTHAKNLPADYTIDAKLVGDDWTNGTGQVSLTTAVDNGVTWDNPKSGSIYWTSGSQEIQVPSGGGSLTKLTNVSAFNITGSTAGTYIVSSSNTNVTASITLTSTSSFGSATIVAATGSFNVSDTVVFASQSLGATISGGTDMTFTLVDVDFRNASSIYISGSGEGGSWLYQSGSGIYNGSLTFYSQSFYTQPGLDLSEDFSYRPTDLNIDVTGAVKTWISGSGGFTIPNYGFLLQFSDADEADVSKAGYVRFFSRETHTVYVPKLTMYFDKSSFATGSLAAMDLDSYTVYTKLKKEYKDSAVTKLRIYARDKYPQKSPTNLFPMTTVKYLPSNTLYTLKDAATDETIIPFDNIYTKVSCDSTSNFVYMDMTGLMPERYYRLEFKVTDGFVEEYIEDDFYFKVVR